MQSVYRISEGAGLALTTARYYTPSGRLIQRPWDGTFDEYLTYTLREQEAEREHNAERPAATPTAAVRSTPAAASSPISHKAGPVEGFNPSRFGRTLWARQTFQDFAQRFTAEGDTRIARRQEPPHRLAATSRSTTRWWRNSRSSSSTRNA